MDMKQKQYGDVVTIVRNGVESNGLVLVSTVIPILNPGVQTEFQKANGLFAETTTVLEEHLTIAFLDPVHAKDAMGSTEMDRAVARVVNVPPIKDGQVNGWKSFVAEIGGENAIAPIEDSAFGAPGQLTPAGERWNELHAEGAKAAVEKFYEEYPDQRPENNPEAQDNKINDYGELVKQQQAASAEGEQKIVEPGTVDREHFVETDESHPEVVDTFHVPTPAEEVPVSAQEQAEGGLTGETHTVTEVVDEKNPDVAVQTEVPDAATEKFAAEPQGEAYAKGEDAPHEQDHNE